MYKENQSQLAGNWVNGTIADGKWLHADGTSFHGKFAKARPIGAGVFYFSNGNMTEGEYIERLVGEDEEDTITVWDSNVQSLTKAPVPASELARSSA